MLTVLKYCPLVTISVTCNFLQLCQKLLAFSFWHGNMLQTSVLHSTSATIKGKVHPGTCHEGPEREQRYSSTLYLTSALERGGWSTTHPDRFTSGTETRYILYRRPGGPQGRCGRVRKISPPRGFLKVSCSLFVLHPYSFLCTDFPGFCLFSLLPQTRHKHTGPESIFSCILSLVLCSYFIRTCFFVLTILHFAFRRYLQHTTQTSKPPAGFEPIIPAI